MGTCIKVSARRFGFWGDGQGSFLAFHLVDGNRAWLFAMTDSPRVGP